MKQKRTRRLYRILTWAGAIIAGIILVLGAVYLVLPKGPRDSMAFNDPHLVDRPAARAAGRSTRWGSLKAMVSLGPFGSARYTAPNNSMMPAIIAPAQVSIL